MKYARRHENDRPDDQRTPGQRDRDRVLYTSAFRRLAGVTQVVSAAEGHIFHNRLTHSLEVAQIGRRIAEYLCDLQKDECERLDGPDPDLVEMAALAHDLGHPPFGHTAEVALDEGLKAAGVESGFEGNPQSFRIVTKLAVRSTDFAGLNLTRGALNAIQKYPWTRGADGFESKKWGAYEEEADLLAWCREGIPAEDHRKSVEAEIMDYADDVAYAVHDVEDFYRAGIVPLEKLLKDPDEFNRFTEYAWSKQKELSETRGRKVSSLDEVRDSIRFLASAPIDEAYQGSIRQRAAIRGLTAYLISRYLKGITLKVPGSQQERYVEIIPRFDLELSTLKQLIWYYVIDNTSLGTQQHGQRHVISELFRMFCTAAESGSQNDLNILPARAADSITVLDPSDSQGRACVVADLIAGMSEAQAITMYQRLIGISFGTVSDLLTL